jgi:hypothetical protein
VSGELDFTDPAIGSDPMTQDIFDLFADGYTADDILSEMPEVQPHWVAREYVDEVVALYNQRTASNLPATTVTDEMEA